MAITKHHSKNQSASDWKKSQNKAKTGAILKAINKEVARVRAEAEINDMLKSYKPTPKKIQPVSTFGRIKSSVKSFLRRGDK